MFSTCTLNLITKRFCNIHVICNFNLHEKKILQKITEKKKHCVTVAIIKKKTLITSLIEIRQKQ